MPASTSGTSLPEVEQLQWENSGRHSQGLDASAFRSSCALTVAGQWRSFTALPEHSVAGIVMVAQSPVARGLQKLKVKS